jgi:hypothetical protein
VFGGEVADIEHRPLQLGGVGQFQLWRGLKISPPTTTAKMARAATGISSCQIIRASSGERFVPEGQLHPRSQALQCGLLSHPAATHIATTLFFATVRAMADHHILILSILLGMAAAGIVFGTYLLHAHG